MLPQSHSAACRLDAEVTARRESAHRHLPPADRRILQPYHRPDVEVHKLSVEVQASFFRYPQLCRHVEINEGVPNPGALQCLHCQWRLKRLEDMEGLHKQVHEDHHQSHDEVQEIDLLHFHGQKSRLGLQNRVLVEEMPAQYDMPKLRGLFDLAGEPPRRQRLHKDKTVARLQGARPPIDVPRFLEEHSDVFAEFQVRRLCEKLLIEANEVSGHRPDKARCTMHEFETSIAKGGLINKLSQRKLARAFDRLLCLEEREHENRFHHRPGLSRNKTMAESAESGALREVDGGAPPLSEAHRKLKRAGTLHVGEIRRQVTQVLDDPPDMSTETPGHSTFHIMTWLRASEHAAVQIDIRIAAGRDMEWQLSVHDLLDTDWPWNPQCQGAEEEGVHDEAGHNFRGLFLGVTSRPLVIGPAYVSTTLSGLRVRDGSVLHRGQMHENLMGKSCQVPIDKQSHVPAVVVLRLDRRKLAKKANSRSNRKYACRLWLQRVSGCEQLDTEGAQILIDDLGIDDDLDLYPAIYASRPESDIRHAVKLRVFSQDDSEGVDADHAGATERPCQDTFSQGMRNSDPTLGFKIDDEVQRRDIDSEDAAHDKHSKFASNVPMGTAGRIVALAGDLVEVVFPKAGSWTVAGKMLTKTNEISRLLELRSPKS